MEDRIVSRSLLNTSFLIYPVKLKADPNTNRKKTEDKDLFLINISILLEEAGEKWGESNADQALLPSKVDYSVPPTRAEGEITTVLQTKKNLDKIDGKPGNFLADTILTLVLQN